MSINIDMMYCNYYNKSCFLYQKDFHHVISRKERLG